MAIPLLAALGGAAMGGIGGGIGAGIGLGTRSLVNRYRQSESPIEFLTRERRMYNPAEERAMAYGGQGPDITANQRLALQQMGQRGLFGSAWDATKNLGYDVLKEATEPLSNYLFNQLGIGEMPTTGEEPGGYQPEWLGYRAGEDIRKSTAEGRIPGFGAMGAAYGSQFGPQGYAISQLLGEQLGSTFGQTPTTSRYPGQYYQSQQRINRPMVPDNPYRRF